ncbi:MAG TPA: peptidoglycan bridge formation glycyltransferase FemA/FemB family protein [Anaerolineae bacterium]|nr:peptidoglycan bridge formation glycyltransferase FemA/FemB family protein [Anaerolineae bacterium]
MIKSTSLHLITTADHWEKALAHFPNRHPLQSWTWGDFKSRWGWSAHPYLLAQSPTDTPLAAALVLKRHIPRTPWCILYLPKGPIFPPDNTQVREHLLDQLQQLAHQQRAIFLKLDPEIVVATGLDEEIPNPHGISFQHTLQQRGWHFSSDQIQFRNTVELDLTTPADDLLAAMKQKTRYNIRLAGRKDVVIRPGTPADWPLILDMYTETAERDGFAIRPAAYYQDAWHSFNQAGIAAPLIAEYKGTPLGAVIMLHYGQRAIYMYGASTDIERRRMPNYLLQWEAIRQAQELGYKTYDFWGAPDIFVEQDRMWGVWRFKSGFQGTVVRHVGAWDYPARPWLYHLYTQAVPRYLNWLRQRRQSS